MSQSTSPSPAGPNTHDPYVAFRIPSFRRLMLANVLKRAAGQMQSVAVGWEVYQRTGSALSLGMTGLVAAIPTIGLSLLAGHVADRFSRKWVVFFAWGVTSITAFVLAGLSHYGHNWSGWLYAVYATLFVNGLAMTFARPARQALLPQIVPAEHFTTAVAWNSSTGEVCSMLGPAIGGGIIWISLPLAYIASGLLTAISVLQVSRIHLLNPPRPVSPDHRDRHSQGIWRTLTAGVRFVWNTKLLLAVMTMDMLAVLFGGATYLLPMFAQRLGVHELGFGGLRAADAFGSLITALILAHLPPMKRAGRTLIFSVLGFGVATIVFGLSKSYVLSLAMLALTGAFDNISVVIRHSLIQLIPPDSMRGRVSAVNMVFVGSSDQLGGVESGLTAAAFGPVASVVGGGIGTILVVLAAAFTWPELWRLGPIRDQIPDPIDADLDVPEPTPAIARN